MAFFGHPGCAYVRDCLFE